MSFENLIQPILKRIFRRFDILLNSNKVPFRVLRRKLLLVMYWKHVLGNNITHVIRGDLTVIEEVVVAIVG